MRHRACTIPATVQHLSRLVLVRDTYARGNFEPRRYTSLSAIRVRQFRNINVRAELVQVDRHQKVGIEFVQAIQQGKE